LTPSTSARKAGLVLPQDQETDTGADPQSQRPDVVAGSQPAPTRQRLVEAAAELLEAGGPAAVTLREVGRQAGVSHNAPYKHFTGKEELLAAVAAAHLRSGRDRVRRLRLSRPPAEAVRLLLHRYARDAVAHPEVFRLTYGRWRGPAPELGDAADAARSELVDTVTAAQRAGDFPAGDPERLTALLLAVAHGAAELALNGHLARDGKGHADPADLIDDLLGRLASR
jgi:AcrR family transcriptional regulator